MNQKQYLKYKKRILEFAKFYRVNIVFKIDKEGDFDYYKHSKNNKKPLIVVKRNHPNNKKIAILLHELGHFLDYKEDNSRWRASEKAYNSYAWNNFLPLGKTNKSVIVNAERRAWHKAEYLLAILQIPRGTWFDFYKKKTLKSYINLQTEED